MIHRLPSVAVACLLTALLAACGRSNAPAPEPPPRPPDAPITSGEPPAGAPDDVPADLTIGVSLLTLSHQFFIDMQRAIEQAAEQRGWETIVVAGEFDPALQQDQVADFIVKGVDAIVLAPCDSKAIGTAIAEANQAGIPVFTADIACTAEGVDVVSHIATDNYDGGRQAAEALIEALKGQGQVAIIDHPTVESVQLRTKGFNDYLREARQNDGVTMEVVQVVPGGGQKDKAFAAAEDLLQAHPDLDGIFAINDPSALGAVAAIEKANRAGEIVVVGFDGQPEGKAAIKAGKIYADPIQFPEQIGRRTVEAIAAYFAGEDVAPEIRIPTELYRQADAQADASVS